MKSILGILTFSLLTMAFSCKNIAMEKFYPILFVNESEHSAEFYFVKPGGGKLYPDTTLAEERPVFVSVPSQKDRPAYLKVEYEMFFNEIPSGILSIFVFHTDIVNNYSWDEIRDNYMILERFDITLEELKESNYRVTYPVASSEGKD